MKNLLLGIDVGTYSSKAVITSLDGEILRSEVVAHSVSTPRLGNVEQDADAIWWGDVKLLCKKLLASGSINSASIVAMAVSAIGPCLLPLAKTGAPLRPAILYGVDTRAEQEIAEMNEEFGEDVIFNHSKMAFSSQAIGPKIRWLQKNEPTVWESTRHISTASSYLSFKLTGKHVLDRHTASHFMPLFDPSMDSWSLHYAKLMGVEIDSLPKLAWSNEIAGEVTESAALETGLAEGTPVAVGAVDALSEAISVGVCSPGDLLIMYGSTTFFILVQASATPDQRVWTTLGAYPGQFNLAAGMSTTGSLTRWFADQLVQELPTASAYKQLFESVPKVPPGSNGLLVLPYFSGERTPINDPNAKGVIAGLTLNHTREHIFRASLEGVAFGIRHHLDTFEQIGAKIKRIVAVGGGATQPTWPQIVSDVCGIKQLMPRVSIGASYGNAFLAGNAIGLFNTQDINDWVQFGDCIEPNSGNRRLYDSMYADYLNLYRGTRQIVHRLGQFTQVNEEDSNA
jgi:xylulokinase